MELGNTTRDVVMQMMGCDAFGITCFYLGELREGRAHLEKALALSDRAHRPSYSNDARVRLRFHSSLLLGCVGHLDQALYQCDAALYEARQLSHPHTLALTLEWHGY
jgi:hypothetical protein